jgi:hypothetical protein
MTRDDLLNLKTYLDAFMAWHRDGSHRLTPRE